MEVKNTGSVTAVKYCENKILILYPKIQDVGFRSISRGRRTIAISIKKVRFSFKRSGRLVTYLPFKEHYGVIMLLASVIEKVNFYKHADYHNKGHIYNSSF